MKKILLALLFVIGVSVASFLAHGGNAYAAARTHERAAFQYYIGYTGQVEWVFIPPQSLNANQTYWVEFPAACMTYNIPGHWVALNNNAIAYIPYTPIDNEYAGQQNLARTANADYWASQVADENASVEADWQILEQDKAISYAEDQGFPDPEAEVTGVSDPANYDTSSDSSSGY